MKNQKGITIVEFIVAIAIATIVAGGAMTLFTNFSKQNASQRKNAELQNYMLTARSMIEKDLRLTGYGISGPGLQIELVDDEADEILMLSFADENETILKSATESNGEYIHVESATGAKADAWLSVGAENGVCRQINAYQPHQDGGFKIYLQEKLPDAPTYTQNDVVKFIKGIKYYMEVQGNISNLVREEDGHKTLLKNIDTFELTALDENNTEITDDFENTRAISVELAGQIERDGNPVQISENIEVNLRNYF